MTRPLARAIMMIALAGMDIGRADWSRAMAAELEVAAADGRALPFAGGCLVAAGRDMLASASGRFVLTSYVLALGIMLPMAALQIGCAIFGFPYLYPDQRGLSGALLVGSPHEALLRSIYLGAVPALALIQLAAGIGHLRLAWSLVERNWPDALRWCLWTLSGVTALTLYMSVLFLDSRQAMLQAAVVGIELVMLVVIVRRHADLPAPIAAEQPG
ncbi:hypothetical protein [Sphingomonas phyllosphaerae]|uniref:hypothetical protein n=1 Tax=Sphingomonas phyllosphaerae TaxID=257003 RepID=UPI00042256FA|nr:hypothetical protein [Sphingomonas phyllosphaerae]